MQYYILKNSNEKKDIGSQYPQIQEMGGTMHKDAPDSIHKVPSGRFPDFITNLNYLILHPKAKLTDVLSVAHISNGFIVNQKIKNIFDNFNLIEHKYFPAIIYHNGTLHNDYFWFCPIGNLIDLIDFNRTEFYIVDSFGDKEPIKVKNKKELQLVYNSTSSLNKIRTDKYFFNNIGSLKDLFFIHFADTRIFISESLLKQLDELKIKGISTQSVTFF